ncbi:MAG TPA: glycoside hydrolase family 2 TIM barrel-domain containing protein [Bryobacteraceae bacterium]|nr:glycoside hydrolase family 2 TIM barrel-domain containing protein [Bryobacteraceae bacterium]
MPEGYPRPLLRRKEWQSLNGSWSFALDDVKAWENPGQVAWTDEIEVPFAPETPRSGIEYRGFCPVFWYKRQIELRRRGDERVLLHFEGVDYRATVWVNGNIMGTNEGGYVPFTFDITGSLNESGSQEIVVRAEDDPHDLAKPRGKQDWKLDAHAIWYPRTSGIWRTVWLERVPAAYIHSLRWTPNLERWEIGLEVHVESEENLALQIELDLSAGDMALAHDRYSVIQGEVYRRISLSDPGIDDFRNELLWGPDHPTLIDASLRLLDEDGHVLDEVSSYTALRSIGVQGNRFVLNGRPVPLRMVLDQGFWPETGATPPDDDALRADVMLVKQMGFNGVRKHQKIEDRRYLFWADVLGLMVWSEMPSAYRYTHRSVRRLTTEWMSVIERDKSHPCIVAWVPFNESWGVPDLPDSPSQRHYVQALYHLTKTLDPSRPVIGNDGWESVATDIIGIHDYESDPALISERYGDEHSENRLLTRERPGGRLLVLSEMGSTDRPLVLSEFGGICYAEDVNATWGYSRCRTPEELVSHFQKLVRAVRASPLLAGYCYTQFTDTYQEANGLLYADRTPKIPLAEIAAANMGPIEPRDELIDSVWRGRLMDLQLHIQRLTSEHS